MVRGGGLGVAWRVQLWDGMKRAALLISPVLLLVVPLAASCDGDDSGSAEGNVVEHPCADRFCLPFERCDVNCDGEAECRDYSPHPCADFFCNVGTACKVGCDGTASCVPEEPQDDPCAALRCEGLSCMADCDGVGVCRDLSPHPCADQLCAPESHCEIDCDGEGVCVPDDEEMR